MVSKVRMGETTNDNGGTSGTTIINIRVNSRRNHVKLWASARFLWAPTRKPFAFETIRAHISSRVTEQPFSSVDVRVLRKIIKRVSTSAMGVKVEVSLLSREASFWKVEQTTL